MNKERRKLLQSIADRLEDMKGEIEAIKDDEDTAMENLPDSFKDGQKGSDMQEAIDSMDTAVSNIDNVISELNDAIAK